MGTKFSLRSHNGLNLTFATDGATRALTNPCTEHTVGHVLTASWWTSWTLRTWGQDSGAAPPPARPGRRATHPVSASTALDDAPEVSEKTSLRGDEVRGAALPAHIDSGGGSEGGEAPPSC